MKHAISIRTVIFSIPVSLQDIYYFRKAITAAVSKLRVQFKNEGIDTSLFHNHNEDTGKTINRYPLIQYKTIRGRASITAINEGAAALEKFLDFLKLDKNKHLNHVHLNGTNVSLEDYRHAVNNPPDFIIRLVPQQKEYIIHYWLPLEEDLHKLWEVENQLVKRVEIMEQCLAKQVEKMLAGMGYTHKLKCSLALSHLLHTHPKTKEYNVDKYAFTCSFRVNLILPEYISLGQATAIGFGNIELFDKERYFSSVSSLTLRNNSLRKQNAVIKIKNAPLPV